MDVLGKEGEKAAEAVQNLSQRLEDLESHLNAVDSAVQDNSETTRELAKKNRHRVVQIEEMLVELTELQEQNLRSIDAGEGHGTKLEKKINAVKEKLRRTRESQKKIENRLDKLDSHLNMKMGKIEKKIFRTENELTQEIELNQGKIESRVTRSKHQKDIQQLEEQISKLKTSMNAISSELEGDNIRIE